MAALKEVLVSDLNKMGVEELRSRGVIALKDPENLTAEHLEKLKLLVNGSLDLGAVNEKLCNLAQAAPANSRSRLSLSPTPDADDPVIAEEDRLHSLRREHKAYHDLIQDTGRPSHRPDDTGFDYLYEPQTGITSYWITMSPRRESIFQTQWTHWQEFREHQDWRRGRYWKPEWFERFVQEVREYRRKKGLEGDIILLQDRKTQSRLQDWAEFQYWEYKKADRFVKEKEQYAEGVTRQEKRLQAAIDAGEPQEKVDMIRDHTLAILKGRRGGARIDLERQSVFLKWIDEQLPIIAFECKTSTLSTQAPNDCQPPSRGTSLGKRKRLADQIGHIKTSRRRVGFADSCDPEPSPARNAVNRNSRPTSLKSQALMTPNTRHRTHRHNTTKACGDHEKIVTLDYPAPVHRKSPPNPTNSSRRSSTRPTSVQSQCEGHSIRAELTTSDSQQQSTAIPVEEEPNSQKLENARAKAVTSSKRRSSTLSDRQITAFVPVHSSRVSKTRVQRSSGMSAEAAHRGDAQRRSRKGKQRDPLALARSGEYMVRSVMQKQLTTDAFPRRSRRLQGKPAIGYFETKNI